MNVKGPALVTIVMYHYVRDLVNSRYPRIKGLDLSLFREQLSYLQANYSIITMQHLISAIDDGQSLPQKAALLTFDDGYVDHFTNVFPVLFDKGIQGSFFVPAKPILENTVLDVNKIHFILASTVDTGTLVRRTFTELDKHRGEYALQSNEHYFEKLAVPSRFDTKEVIFFKRLLQKELPDGLRNIIASNLFEEFVGIRESAFSKELYMSMEQIQCMLQNGMHIGSHGYDHYWLNSLSEENQRKEIKKGREFLTSIGVETENWTMCYPYGCYDQGIVKILIETNCKLALTTRGEVADLCKHNRFELPRLDTNDIPKCRIARCEVARDRSVA